MDHLLNPKAASGKTAVLSPVPVPDLRYALPALLLQPLKAKPHLQGLASLVRRVPLSGYLILGKIYGVSYQNINNRHCLGTILFWVTLWGK